MTLEKMIKLFIIGTILFFTFGCEKKYDYVHNDINSSADTVIPLNFLNNYKDYWEAFSKNDFKRTYELELPYLNFLKSFEWYKTFRSESKKNFEVIMKEIDKEDENIIYIRTEIKYVKGNGYTFNDKWILINNNWYHSYIQSRLPPLPTN